MRDESGWGFVDGYGDADRVALLMDHGTSFDQIVIGLVDGARVVCARWEWGRVGGELDGYVRANLEILAHEDAVDLFHNGCDGYRARYYRSEDAGEAANLACVEAFIPLALTQAPVWGLLLRDPGFPVGWKDIAMMEVERSLRADGAKAWISEPALHAKEPYWAPANIGEVKHELDIERWMEEIALLPLDAPNALLAGTRAFRVDTLGIKGGFIVPGEPNRPAKVPERKKCRSNQIHRLGYT